MPRDRLTRAVGAAGARLRDKEKGSSSNLLPPTLDTGRSSRFTVGEFQRS